MQSDLLRFQDVEHPGAIPKTCLGHDGNLGTWREHPYQLWTHHVGLWHTISFRWSNFPQKERQQPLKPIQNAENSLAKKTIDRSAQTLPFRETGQLQIGPFCRANIERIMPQPVLTALCPLFVPQQHQIAALLPNSSPRCLQAWQKNSRSALHATESWACLFDFMQRPLPSIATQGQHQSYLSQLSAQVT